MSEKPIRVLLVDDHEIVRKGLSTLLETEQGIEVVGQAGTGAEALALAGSLEPDVILMDLVMPEMDGVEAIRQLQSRQSSARILVLTSFGSDDKVFPAIQAGALGYLLKDTTPEDLVEAIRQAADGQSPLNPTVARRLLSELSRQEEPPQPAEPLTEREVEVLRWVARGLNNERIAEALSISEATVRTHVSHVLGKLNLSNRTQAALYALRQGIASLEDYEDRGPESAGDE